MISQSSKREANNDFKRYLLVRYEVLFFEIKNICMLRIDIYA